MPKTAIGQIGQKILIEGDPNLLTRNEILVREHSKYGLVFMIRNEEGGIDAYALTKITLDEEEPEVPKAPDCECDDCEVQH